MLALLNLRPFGGESAVAHECEVTQKSVTAISICSGQFQFYSGQFQFAQGNFNLIMAISIYSRQFQFYSAISICSQQFQFYSRQFRITHRFWERSHRSIDAQK